MALNFNTGLSLDPMNSFNLIDLEANFDTSKEEVMFLKERGLSLKDIKDLARVRHIVRNRHHTEESHGLSYQILV